MTLNQMDFVTMGCRKMWTKFKHWLIRKLGGYVAPCSNCAKYITTIIQTQKPIEKIEEWLNMNECNYMGYDYKNNQPIAKTDVAQRIFRHLAMGDYIKYEYGDDGILRGTLMVVKQP